MSSPLTSEQFVRLLDDRLYKVAEKTYMDLPRMRDKIFTIVNEKRAFLEMFGVSDVPDISEFNGKLSTVSVSPGFYNKLETKQYASQIIAERRLIENKRYPVLDRRAAGLMESANRVQEKLAVGVFNNAFSSAFDFMTREENVALCSDSHTNKTGASTTTGFDNAGTTALSKTAIAATRLLMRKFKSDIGERIDVGDELALIVPDALYDTAMEITGTIKGYDAANETKNMDYGRYKVIPWLRLDDNDANNWFMVDMKRMKKNLIFWEHTKPEYKNTIDWDTYALKQAVYMDCGAGFDDWRWVYGHNVS